MSVLKIVNINYVSILLLVILMIMPLFPKIKQFWYKDMGFILTGKEAEELEEQTEKAVPDEEFIKIRESKSETEELIEELIEIGNREFNLGLAAIRLNLEKDIREIFIKSLKGKIPKKTYYSPGPRWNIRRMSRELHNNKVIDKITYEILLKVIDACNKAVHGFEIEDENAEILYESALRLVAYFHELKDKL